MKKIVIIMNGKFMPKTMDSHYIYGVVQHALQTAKILSDNNQFGGFIFYERVEEINDVRVTEKVIYNKYNSVKVSFNFNLSNEVIKHGFIDAVNILKASFQKSELFLYSQTITIAKYLPADYPILITNHGPFALNVQQAIGKELAEKAFNYEHVKFPFLLKSQKDNIFYVKNMANVFFLEISLIQVEYLKSLGIPKNKIFHINPPLEEYNSNTTDLHEPIELEQFLQNNEHPILFTVVSRLDDFKNVELLVSTAARMIENNPSFKVIIIGGEVNDKNRIKMKSSLKKSISGNFLFVSRVEHQVLIKKVIPLLSDKGIFICTSRFDLVPYTVLEFSRKSIVTFVPNSKYVGAGLYFPNDFKYEYTSQNLEKTINDYLKNGEKNNFYHTYKLIKEKTSNVSYQKRFSEILSLIR